MRALFDRYRIYVLVAVAALAAAGYAVTAELTDGGATITFQKIPQPGPDAKVQIDEDQQREAGERAEAAKGTKAPPPIVAPPQTVATPGAVVTPDVHEDAKDEVVPGLNTAKEVEVGKRASEKAARGQLSAPRETGGAQNYSCITRHVVNWSGLSQRRVGTALHFTVSGTGSINAIHDLFNRPSFGASSNYGIELTHNGSSNGTCQLWVSESRKAWAQGAANSAYVSIEIISFNRTRVQWLADPIIRDGRLASLVRDIQGRVGAPNRYVDPVGCVWPAGITDHDALECGNTHWDVGENFPWDVFIRQVQQGVIVVPPKAIRLCTELSGLRARQAKGDHLSRRQRFRKDRLDYYFGINHDRGNLRYTCGKQGAGVGGPVSRDDLPPPVEAVRRCREYNKFRLKAKAGEELGTFAETRLDQFLRPYFASDRLHENRRYVYRCSFERGPLRRPA